MPQPLPQRGARTNLRQRHKLPHRHSPSLRNSWWITLRTYKPLRRALLAHFADRHGNQSNRRCAVVGPVFSWHALDSAGAADAPSVGAADASRGAEPTVTPIAAGVTHSIAGLSC